MLTDKAIEYLKPLTFSEKAERVVCFIPLGGIYWEDEITDFRDLMKMSEEDRDSIYNLFRIRFKIWNGDSLEGNDKIFWDTAITQVPNYALFQRLNLSEEDRAAQDEVETGVEEGFGALFEDADEVNTTEKDGFQKFTATFDLTKDNDDTSSSKLD